LRLNKMNNHTSIERGFLRKWVLANAIGLGAGMAIFAAVAEGIEQSGVLGSAETGEIVGHLVGLLLAGAMFGRMQSGVLRHYVDQPGWALLVAAVGLYLGYGLGYEILGFPFDYIVGPGLAAGLSALVHWRALRLATRTSWWVPTSTLAFMLGSLPGLALAFLGLGEAIGSTYLGWIALNGLMCTINGAIGGTITGMLLMRVLRRITPSVSSSPLASSTR
jgi:hypothetical protein